LRGKEQEIGQKKITKGEKKNKDNDKEKKMEGERI